SNCILGKFPVSLITVSDKMHQSFVDDSTTMISILRLICTVKINDSLLGFYYFPLLASENS
ncbi:MAG: hypothetical protein MH132_11660, partial [Hydrotalea sp.]|nr:hypothetical protein [Hydrotalea sp.]